jgi:hypothetical protein
MGETARDAERVSVIDLDGRENEITIAYASRKLVGMRDEVARVHRDTHLPDHLDRVLRCRGLPGWWSWRWLRWRWLA